MYVMKLNITILPTYLENFQTGTPGALIERVATNCPIVQKSRLPVRRSVGPVRSCCDCERRPHLPRWLGWGEFGDTRNSIMG